MRPPPSRQREKRCITIKTPNDEAGEGKKEGENLTFYSTHAGRSEGETKSDRQMKLIARHAPLLPAVYEHRYNTRGYAPHVPAVETVAGG